jgi:hypothetical protein
MRASSFDDGSRVLVQQEEGMAAPHPYSDTTDPRTMPGKFQGRRHVLPKKRQLGDIDGAWDSLAF